MKIYYAHCMAIYNTPQEQRDLKTLTRTWPNWNQHTIVNPNDAEITEICNRYRQAPPDGELLRGRDDGVAMLEDVFQRLIRECHVFAFRALPDGRIPSGVAQELAWAREFDKVIFELPSNVTARTMTLSETREYLHEVGQR